jgi:hypothetical protein
MDSGVSLSRVQLRGDYAFTGRAKKNGQTADTQNPISKGRRRLGDALP